MLGSPALKPRFASRRGYTMVEVFAVLVLIGLLLLLAIPRVGKGVTTTRIDRAASMIALTLERAFTLAARQRQPIVIRCDCPSQAVELKGRNSAEILVRRVFGADTEYHVESLALSQDSVIVFPNGVSDLPLTVSISSGATTRQVTLSQAGQVRVVR